MDFWRLERWVRNHQSRRLSDGDIVYVEDGTLRVLAIGTAGQVLTADPAGTHKLKWAASGGGGGGGVTDHTALTSLRWSAAGHTDTANRIAGFNGSNAAALYEIGLDLQAWDIDLDAVAGLTQSGLAVRVSAGNWALRTIQGPTAGLTIANPGGVAGNPTFALSDDLAAVEGLSTTGLAVRTGVSTWTTRSMVAPAAGLTIADPGGVAGPPTFSLANDLAALEGLSTTGFAQRTGTDTWSLVTAATIVGVILTTKGDLLGYDSAPVRLPVGANGSVLMADSSATPGLAYVDTLHPSLGSGGDGNVTISVNTTLTQPQNYADLTINTGVRLIASGYPIRVSGTLTFGSSTAIISCNGTDGAGTTGGVGGPAGLATAGGTGGFGFTGAGNGNVGGSRTNSLAALAAGGTAGDGGKGGDDPTPTRIGGAGGDAAPPVTTNRNLSLFTWDTFYVPFSINATIGGGGGGGGGANNGAGGAISGGGGGGGGVVVIWANKVTGAGVVEANGGAGAVATGAAGAGAGGGGGGGVAVLWCKYVSGTAPTVRANGGAGGAGSGSTVGVSGVAGYAALRRIV